MVRDHRAREAFGASPNPPLRNSPERTHRARSQPELTQAVTSERHQVPLLEQAPGSPARMSRAEEVPKVRVDPIPS